MNDYGEARWGSLAVRAWMIFEDATGHRQGFEIPVAEVEYRYDCDLADSDLGNGMITTVPVNRKWQWHITTYHGFTMYQPAPADPDDRSQQTITAPRKEIKAARD